MEIIECTLPLACELILHLGSSGMDLRWIIPWSFGPLANLEQFPPRLCRALKKQRKALSNVGRPPGYGPMWNRTETPIISWKN